MTDGRETFGDTAVSIIQFLFVLNESFIRSSLPDTWSNDK